MLKILGLQADEAINGVDALNKIEESKGRKCCGNYSLVFMDCNMPVMDGYQAAKEIAQMVYNNIINPCLVIAVTAYHSTHNVELCINAGMHYVISKPASIDKLKNAFQEMELFGF